MIEGKKVTILENMHWY